jgi:hypothetical protein
MIGARDGNRDFRLWPGAWSHATIVGVCETTREPNRLRHGRRSVSPNSLIRVIPAKGVRRADNCNDR